MNLLEKLKPHKPKRAGYKRIDEQYEMTLDLLPEINEAREYGYSWTQICNAIYEELLAQGKWNPDWRRRDFEDNYRKIAKGGGSICQSK